MALSLAARVAAATEICTDYAPGAPASVMAAAVQLLAESIKVGPEVSDVQFADQQVSYHAGVAMLRRCGGASLLSQWRRPRARPVEAAP